MKLYLLGFGAVARSFMRMVRDRRAFPLSDITVIDRVVAVNGPLAEITGGAATFCHKEIRRDNLDEVLSMVKAGDIVFNLGDMLGARMICEWCMARGIHYLSTSSDDFPDGNLDTPSFTFDEYRLTRQMFDQAAANSPSTVVSSGMNPGAVSLFAKLAIAELNGSEPKDYAAAARALGVVSVDITDIDDSELKIKREPGIVYSTWSPIEFFTEATLNVEVIAGVGVLRRYEGRPVDYADEEGGFLALTELAYEHPVRSVALGSDGKLHGFFGSTVPHDEVVSIPSYLTVRENGKVVYRPESRFVYRACKEAHASVAEIVASGRPPRGFHLITADEIASGGESVGILVTLASGDAIYVGTRYDIGGVPAGDTPTVLQVAAGCFAALRHVLTHPTTGPKFPEELDAAEFIRESGLPLVSMRLKAGELEDLLK